MSKEDVLAELREMREFYKSNNRIKEEFEKEKESFLAGCIFEGRITEVEAEEIKVDDETARLKMATLNTLHDMKIDITPEDLNCITKMEQDDDKGIVTITFKDGSQIVEEFEGWQDENNVKKFVDKVKSFNASLKADASDVFFDKTQKEKKEIIKDVPKKELDVGKDIEKEHKPTIEKIAEYYAINKKLPPNEWIYEWIALDHIDEFKKYYNDKIGLPEMERRFEDIEKEIKPELEVPEKANEAVANLKEIKRIKSMIMSAEVEKIDSWSVKVNGKLYAIKSDKNPMKKLGDLELDIQNYKSELDERQERNYGDLNIDIKIRGDETPTEEIKKKYPKVTDDEISQAWNDLASIYIGQEIDYIKNEYNLEAGVAGRSSGWFYVKGIDASLDEFIEEINEIRSWDEKTINKEIDAEYIRIKNNFDIIQERVDAIEKDVMTMVDNFKKEVASMKFWDKQFGVESAEAVNLDLVPGKVYDEELLTQQGFQVGAETGKGVILWEPDGDGWFATREPDGTLKIVKQYYESDPSKKIMNKIKARETVEEFKNRISNLSFDKLGRELEYYRTVKDSPLAEDKIKILEEEIKKKEPIEECPGSKKRSKGEGKGLGIGQRKGPLGYPKASNIESDPSNKKIKATQVWMENKEKKAVEIFDDGYYIEFEKDGLAIDRGKAESKEKAIEKFKNIGFIESKLMADLSKVNRKEVARRIEEAINMVIDEKLADFDPENNKDNEIVKDILRKAFELANNIYKFKASIKANTNLYLDFDDAPDSVKKTFYDYIDNEKFLESLKKIDDTITQEAIDDGYEHTFNFDPETISKEKVEKEGIYDITSDLIINGKNKSYFISLIVNIDKNGKFINDSVEILSEHNIESDDTAAHREGVYEENNKWFWEYKGNKAGPFNTQTEAEEDLKNIESKKDENDSIEEKFDAGTILISELSENDIKKLAKMIKSNEYKFKEKSYDSDFEGADEKITKNKEKMKADGWKIFCEIDNINVYYVLFYKKGIKSKINLEEENTKSHIIGKDGWELWHSSSRGEEYEYHLHGKLEVKDVPEEKYEENKEYFYAVVNENPKIYVYVSTSEGGAIGFRGKGRWSGSASNFGKSIEEELGEIIINNSSGYAIGKADMEKIIAENFPKELEIKVINKGYGWEPQIIWDKAKLKKARIKSSDEKWKATVGLIDEIQKKINEVKKDIKKAEDPEIDVANLEKVLDEIYNILNRTKFIEGVEKQKIAEALDVLKRSVEGTDMDRPTKDMITELIEDIANKIKDEKLTADNKFKKDDKVKIINIPGYWANEKDGVIDKFENGLYAVKIGRFFYKITPDKLKKIESKKPDVGEELRKKMINIEDMLESETLSVEEQKKANDELTELKKQYRQKALEGAITLDTIQLGDRMAYVDWHLKELRDTETAEVIVDFPTEYEMVDYIFETTGVDMTSKISAQYYNNGSSGCPGFDKITDGIKEVDASIENIRSETLDLNKDIARVILSEYSIIKKAVQTLSEKKNDLRDRVQRMMQNFEIYKREAKK